MMSSCMNVPDIVIPKSKGQIQIIFGPMFSGKTTELIRRLKRFHLANYDCLVVKYANDDRYEAKSLATHDGHCMKSSVSASKLLPLMDEALNFDVVGVDEGQFYPDTVEFCERLAAAGKTVIVAALDGTYQREGFGRILELVPLAENVVKLTAVCMMCYGEAAFTKRRGAEKELEVIGGADKYLAVCRDCYKASPSKSPAQRFKENNGYVPNKTEKENAKNRLFGKEITNGPLQSESCMES